MSTAKLAITLQVMGLSGWRAKSGESLNSVAKHRCSVHDFSA